MPELYKEATGLSILSTLVGRKVYALHSVTTYFPNLYVLLVGDSGCGKGTAINQVGEKFVGKVAPERVLPDEFTPEALIANLSKQPWGTVFNDEVTTILSKRDYMDNMAPALAKLYNPLDRVILSRKKESFTVNEPYLGLFLGVQPHLFSSVMTARSLNLGLISRLIIIDVKASQYRMPGDRSSTLGARALTSIKEFYTGLNLMKQRIRIKIPEELFTYVMSYCTGKLRAVEDEAGTYYGRLSDNIIKLGILYHINASMPPLNLSHSPSSLHSEPLPNLNILIDDLDVLMTKEDVTQAIDFFEKIDPNLLSLLRLTLVSEDSRVFERYKRAAFRLIEKGSFLDREGKKYIRKKDLRRGVGISSRKGFAFIQDLQDANILGLEIKIGERVYYEFKGEEDK
jgi:hypothetical protein